MTQLNMYEIKGGTLADIDEVVARVKLYRLSGTPPVISFIINTETGYIIRYYSQHKLTENSTTPNDVVFDIQ